MAEQKTTGEMKATLGLTGLTFNAMALIAPGAFLWLTFYEQATEGATSPSMLVGIVFAVLLCLAPQCRTRSYRSSILAQVARTISPSKPS
jgi:hypothetical protein